MKKSKNAKKVENSAFNIDADAVKNLFKNLLPKGVILKSTTPQLKDLGMNDFHYTMRGVNEVGQPCVLVLNSKRDKVSAKECRVMKSVDASIVARVNAEFATKTIVALCTEKFAVTGEARPVEIPAEKGVHYGYAMCAKQGTQNGFAVMENGANGVQFTNVAPKFL